MKKGTLKMGPPEKDLMLSTFDWEGTRRAYYDRLDAQIAEAEARGLPPEKWDSDMKWRLVQREQGLRAAREMVEKKPLKPKVAKKEPKVKNEGRGKRFDRDAMVRMYTVEKFLVSQIAEAMGCSPQTVVNGLRAKEVYEPGRDLGQVAGERYDISQHRRPRRDVCGKGLHLMLKYGRPIMVEVNGEKVESGRYCSACSMIRGGADPKRFDEVPRD
jgi:hypothetical protein